MGKKSKKSAQQLVEFALILPMLMIILIVIVEIGFALNIRLSLTEAVKLSVAQAKISFNQTGTTLQDKLDTAKTPILNSIKTYFSSHNLPYADTLTASISPLSGNQMALVMVNYKYKPVFSLPNIFGGTIIPAEYSFTSTQVINASLLDVNSEVSGFTASELSSFGKEKDNFDPRTSVLKNQDVHGIDVRYQTAFLIGFNTNNYKYSRLFNWWGEDLLPQNLALNMQSGNLMVKSPYYTSSEFSDAPGWMDTDIPYTWVLSSLGFTQAVYSRMDLNPFDFRTDKLDLASSEESLNADIPWFNQASCSICGTGGADPFKGDMSASNIDNLIKRGLSLFYSSTGSAAGSFDPLQMISDINNPTPVRNYTFVKPVGGTSNLLKLFIPNSATKPNDTFNGFNYSFNLDSGKLAGSGTLVDIVDCYIDSDGDGIPNAWDSNPEYMDADGNGKIDGQETSLSGTVTALPDPVSVTDNVFVNTFRMYLPFVAGSTSVANPSHTYTPSYQLVDIYRVPTQNNAWYYYKPATNNLSRQFTGWNYSPSVDTSKKVRFIFGSDGTTTINLNKSVETDKLNLTPFSSTNKVYY